ncbi:hypothetical protein I2I11_02330 [Pontibacter sp. 172403-2]|uniref:hypothetical protein n=1 Tax=Pontibacter rufus TaxID=2791028 RepID=UPI0018AF9D63|nr:hypothetical protein [Pontibacter sp. 172403-2]MBF9252121.1 hypothetical protein [Pontibacter sp. 172403-2]
MPDFLPLFKQLKAKQHQWFVNKEENYSISNINGYPFVSTSISITGFRTNSL